MNLPHLHHIALSGSTMGNQRFLGVHRFGPETAGLIYMQAAVHADELPGSVVLHQLAQALERLQAAGRVHSRIVLVPCANPLGAAQHMQGGLHGGRFDWASGINFNRQFPDLSATAIRAAQSLSGLSASDLISCVRNACSQVLSQWPCINELEHWRVNLLQLAIQADWVIDLHCDQEAVMHLYCAPELWPHVQPLAGEMGSALQLLDSDSSHGAFDSACMQPWFALGSLSHFDELPCKAITLELRGQADVSHDLAQQDAQGLLRWLAQIGAVSGIAMQEPVPLLAEPRPLTGVESVYAPHGGVFVPRVALGTELQAGQVFGQLIDVSRGITHDLVSRYGGLHFARTRLRAVAQGTELAKIAGKQPTRQGALLSL